MEVAQDPKAVTTEEAAQGETDEQALQRCIDMLEHSYRCQDPECKLIQCQKLKRIIAHAHECKLRLNGECPICRKLTALCCSHAKRCTMPTCTAPYCVSIKRKLRELAQQQAARVDGAAVNMAPHGDQQHPTGPQLPQAHQLLDMLHKPRSENQRQQVLHILKSNPAIMAAFIKQGQVRKQKRTGAITQTAMADKQQQQLTAPELQQQKRQKQQKQEICRCTKEELRENPASNVIPETEKSKNTL